MKAAIRFAGLLSLMLTSSQVLAAYQLNLKPGVTSLAKALTKYTRWSCGYVLPSEPLSSER